MSNYVGNARERVVQLLTPVFGPSGGEWGPAKTAPLRSWVPHITLSPRSSRGLPTAGLALVLVEPSTGAAVATAPGFTVQIFRAIPALGAWSALQSLAGVNYRDQLVLPDLSGGMGLYFNIVNVAADGAILVALAELD